MSAPPIIPVSAQPMRTLTLSMAIMCYLATLSVGALLLVHSAVAQWTSGIAQEVTVQVRPMADTDLPAETGKVTQLLQSTPGVASVRLLDRKAVENLLRPWLGDSPVINDLPLPALIAVTIDENNPPDFAALENNLREKAKGVSLDTHRRWQAQLTRTAATLQRLSLAVLALIALSSAGLVVFATRSVLESNREVIDVLHMIGAKDGFIARAVKGRFLRSGFLAGMIGTLGGIMTFAFLGLVGMPGDGDALSEASASLLLAPPSVAAAIYGVFFLVPVVATLLSVVTAHFAVMRQLRTIV